MYSTVTYIMYLYIFCTRIIAFRILNTVLSNYTDTRVYTGGTYGTRLKRFFLTVPTGLLQKDTSVQ